MQNDVQYTKRITKGCLKTSVMKLNLDKAHVLLLRPGVSVPTCYISASTSLEIPGLQLGGTVEPILLLAGTPIAPVSISDLASLIHTLFTFYFDYCHTLYVEPL